MEAVPWEELKGKHLIIEEKLDGANSGISFDEAGKLLIQSRGHYLRGGPREKHFDLLKQWASARQTELFSVLGSRYVMYGEWMYAKHTMYYDELPHYFMEFDVLDTHDGWNIFLDTANRRQMFCGTNIVPVKVLWEGIFDNIDTLRSMLTRSYFISDDVTRLKHLGEAAIDAGVDPQDALKHTDMKPQMEGLYVKWEENGIVKGRYKFVRDSFTSAILDQEQHWHDRPIIANRLSGGALERMFA